MDHNKVNLYSAVDLRNECDEKLAPVLESLKFIQSFKVIDTKIALGYLAIGTSGLLYYLEKLYKNDMNNKEYLLYTAILIVTFFALNFINYLIGKFIEKNVTYTGYDKKGNRIDIETSIDPSTTVPIYKTAFIYNSNEKEKVICEIEFAKLFNEDGYLQAQEFREFLIAQVNKVTSKKNQ